MVLLQTTTINFEMLKYIDHVVNNLTKFIYQSNNWLIIIKRTNP